MDEVIVSITKVLELLISYIQTESYELILNHRELLKHRHQQKYLLLKLIDHLR
jgi:hypothetical protein